MASGVIQQPNPITIINSYIAGTGKISLQNLNAIRSGNMVILSVRVKITEAIDDAQNTPLIVLRGTTVRSTGSMPSYFSLFRSNLNVSYACGAKIVLHSSGEYVLEQTVASNLSVDDILSLFVIFPVV